MKDALFRAFCVFMLEHIQFLPSALGCARSPQVDIYWLCIRKVILDPLWTPVSSYHWYNLFLFRNILIISSNPWRNCMFRTNPCTVDPEPWLISSWGLAHHPDYFAVLDIYRIVSTRQLPDGFSPGSGPIIIPPTETDSGDKKPCCST